MTVPGAHWSAQWWTTQQFEISSTKLLTLSGIKPWLSIRIRYTEALEISAGEYRWNQVEENPVKFRNFYVQNKCYNCNNYCNNDHYCNNYCNNHNNYYNYNNYYQRDHHYLNTVICSRVLYFLLSSMFCIFIVMSCICVLMLTL
jgi:hypothetical protein